MPRCGVLTGVVGNQCLHPIIPDGPHCRVGRVKIGQGDSGISQPTVLYIILVAVVGDETVWMEVTRGIKRSEDLVVYRVARSVVALNGQILMCNEEIWLTIWLATTSTIRYIPRACSASARLLRS
jgi:hypothetical protein